MSRGRTVADGPSASAIWFQSTPPGSWAANAECRKYLGYADAFTEVSTFAEADVALRICAACPVRRQCLGYGRAIEADGVWGGELLHRGDVRRRRAAS